MKKLPFLILSGIFVASCSGLTENEARTKMNAEAEKLSIVTCDCINNLEKLEGDARIEAESDCKGQGQMELLNLSQAERISDNYPKVKEEAVELYFKRVEECNQ